MIRPKDRKSKYLNGKGTTKIEHKKTNCAFKKNCCANNKYSLVYSSTTSVPLINPATKHK